mmetsp:Transcript_5088/g.3739  ORF Transcript_5088/g.3739 Transcript_5088/m.3739 type:complete len:112 (+) Transcript_5088:542-877(+)
MLVETLIEPRSKESFNIRKDKTLVHKKAVEIMLKIVGLYPLDLFKLEVKHLLAKMVKNNILEFPAFIDNLLKTPAFLKHVDRACIPADKITTFVLETPWPAHDENKLKELF